MKPDYTSSKSLRGQALSFDFIIAASAFLFVTALLLSQVFYSMRGTEEFRSKNRLLKEVDAVSEIFFGEGLPKDWTNQTVSVIGLEENGRIDSGKIYYFQQIPYQKTIGLLGLSNNYNITIYQGEDPVYSFGAGYENSTSIVKRERLGVLENGTLVRIVVLVFEK